MDIIKYIANNTDRNDNLRRVYSTALWSLARNAPNWVYITQIFVRAVKTVCLFLLISLIYERFCYIVEYIILSSVVMKSLFLRRELQFPIKSLRNDAGTESIVVLTN